MDRLQELFLYIFDVCSVDGDGAAERFAVEFELFRFYFYFPIGLVRYPFAF